MRRIKKTLLFALLTLITISGCSRKIELSNYLISSLDAVYKGNYQEYSGYTGLTTTEISSIRNQWLASRTDSFIEFLGGDPSTISDDMRKRISDLLTAIYSNARYEVSDPGENGSNGKDSSVTESNEPTHEEVTITVYPITLIKNNYKALSEYMTSFSENNEKYGYADMTSSEYQDAYLEGIITILEAQLTDIPYGKAETITVEIGQTEKGLYEIDSKSMSKIDALIIKKP